MSFCKCAGWYWDIMGSSSSDVASNPDGLLQVGGLSVIRG